MAEPVLSVEFAFASDPLSGTQTWSDVSDYVRSVSISRGRENELDEVKPGTCAIRSEERR